MLWLIFSHFYKKKWAFYSLLKQLYGHPNGPNGVAPLVSTFVFG
jgi:hypothetical protein